MMRFSLVSQGFSRRFLFGRRVGLDRAFTFASILATCAALVASPLPAEAQGAFMNTGFWHPQQMLSITSPGSTVASRCSGAYTITTLNAANAAAAVSADTTVNLSGSGTTTFYSDKYCTQAITSVTVLNGASTATFYALNTAVTTTDTITADLTGYKTAINTMTTTTNNFVWKGTSASGGFYYFSDGANWSGGVAPGASDIAVFDGTCTNCNPSFNAAVSVAGIRLQSNYTGTITQPTQNFTFGSSHFVMNGGTFVGTTTGSTFAVNYGDMVINGGNFTASTGTTTLRGAIKVYATATVSMPSGSTLNLTCVNGDTNCDTATVTIVPGTVTYQNVNFNGYATTYSLGGATMSIAGNLAVGDQKGASTAYAIDNGTINFTGSGLSVLNNGNVGTAIITVAGKAAGQTITGTAGKSFPPIKIDAGTNPVTLSGTVSVPNWNYVASGTFTVAGSTLDINCQSTLFYVCYGGTASDPTIKDTGATYNDVKIRGRNTAWVFTGTMNVAGNLTIGDYTSSVGISGGTIKVAGDVTLTGFGNYGSTVIELTGKPAGQTITGIASTPFPKIKLNTGTNPVTLSGTIQTSLWEVASVGTMTVTGSTLNIVCYSGSDWTCNGTSTASNLGTGTYNDVSIQGRYTTWDLTGSNAVINGNLSIGDISSGSYSISGGTLSVAGNVTYINNGYRGTTLIKLTGNGAGQTITGGANRMPSFEIATGGNAVTITGLIDTQLWTVTSVGTFTSTGSTLQLNCNNCSVNATVVLKPGTVNYNNVNFVGRKTQWDLSGDTFIIGGDLSITDQLSGGNINNGTLQVGGNVALSNFGDNGTAATTLNGTSSKTFTLTGTPAVPDGLITVAKTGGATVTLGSAVNFNGTGQDVTVSSGSLLMAGYALTIADTLTIAAGATVTRSSGTLTYGTLSNSGTLNP